MNCSVEVKTHPTLNQTQGTIFAPDLLHLSSEELAEDWVNQGHKITKVYRFQRKEDGILKQTPKLLLTFDGLCLPETIWHGFRRYSTQLFIPNPMRCFKCNRIGHTFKNCRSPFDTCMKCSEGKHELPCNNTPRCINCNQDHSANSPNCIIYKIAKETIAIKTKERCSYREAKQRAEETFKNDYAGAIGSKTPLIVQHLATPYAAHAVDNSIIKFAKPSLKDIPRQGNKRPTFKESSTDEEQERRVKIPKRPISEEKTSAVVLTVDAEIHHTDSSQPLIVLATPPRMAKPAAQKNVDTMDPIELELEVLDGTPITKDSQKSQSMETSQVSHCLNVSLPTVKVKSLIKDFPMPPHFSTSPSEGRKKGRNIQPDSPRPKSKKDVKYQHKLDSLKSKLSRDDFLKPKLLNKPDGKPKDPRKRTISTIVSR
jgi:hypothetical protein